MLLVNMVVPENDAKCFSELLDLNMLVMNGGRKRTKAEFLCSARRRRFQVHENHSNYGTAEHHRSRAEINVSPPHFHARMTTGG